MGIPILSPDLYPICYSVIVGQTRYSYTYTQPLRVGGYYPMYHGTLEARALGPSRTTLYYTLGWDDSVRPDDATRKKQIDTYRALFEKTRSSELLEETGSGMQLAALKRRFPQSPNVYPKVQE